MARPGRLTLSTCCAAVWLCLLPSCDGKPITSTVTDGELRASPSGLDFGRTWLTTTRTLTIDVSNTARTPRSLQVHVEGAGFASELQLALAGGDTASFPLSFTPSAPGISEGRVTFSDASGRLEVPLVAAGLALPTCPAAPCERSDFSTELGRCVTTLLPDSTACSPGCNATGVCVAGECRLSSAGLCDDGNPCTIDGCAADGGCLRVPKACPVSGACKVASCDPAQGCTELPVEDGAFCGEPTCATVQLCLSGSCQARPTPDHERQCAYTDLWTTSQVACAKTLAGTTRCWGDNGADGLLRGFQALSVPPGPLPIGFEVSSIVGGDGFCVLDAAGHLVCPPAFDGGAELFRDYAFGFNDCGVLTDGGLFGRCRFLPDGGAPLLTPAARVWGQPVPVVTCVETAAGAIGCWGSGARFSTATQAFAFEFLPLTERVRSFGLSSSAYAVLADGGFKAWGAATTELLAYPVTQGGPWLDAVASQVGTVWGRRDDGSVEACRLAPSDGGLTRDCQPLPGQHHFSKLTAGTASACGLEDGGVWCWGTNLSGELGAPLQAQAPHRLPTTDLAFIGEDLWLRDAGVRFRRNGVTESGTGLAGLSDVCGRVALRNGSLFTFDPTTGQTSLLRDGGATALQPLEFGRGCEGVPVDALLLARSASPSNAWRCSLWVDAGITCEGRTNGSFGFGPRDAGAHDLPETPMAVPPAVELRGSGLGACMLTGAGRVWCWGDLLGAPVPTELPLVGVRQLECGSEHCCALAGENDVRCWGLNRNNELGTPGPPSVRPRPVAIGERVERLSHGAGCAVLKSGGAICWGPEQFDAVLQSDVPLQVVK